MVGASAVVGAQDAFVVTKSEKLHVPPNMREMALARRRRPNRSCVSASSTRAEPSPMQAQRRCVSRRHQLGLALSLPTDDRGRGWLTPGGLTTILTARLHQ